MSRYLTFDVLLYTKFDADRMVVAAEMHFYSMNYDFLPHN